MNLMVTSLSESPQEKSLLFTTKGGVTLRNQYLQLFLLLENDGVAQTLASGFPTMPAIHISGQGACQWKRQPSVEGHRVLPASAGQ